MKDQSKPQLDDIDIQILNVLQDNCKLTTKELAAHVHLSSTPVFERVKRLEKEGVIRQYSAIIDNELLGNGFCVFCNIRLKKHSKEYILHFIDAIQKVDEIVECYNISGDFDFMLKIYVRNMSHYQEFVQNKLGVIESVGSLHSLFVLKEIKHKQAMIPTEQG
jgi:DNA-binding Lrp family transcriptional regulator